LGSDPEDLPSTDQDVEAPVGKDAHLESEVEPAGEPQAEEPVPLSAGEEEQSEESVSTLPWDEDDEETEPLELAGEGLNFWREEAKPLLPEEPGAMLAGRFVVLEILDAQEHEILYLAHDLRRCWQCHSTENSSGSEFCAACGAALDRRVEVHLLEVQSAVGDPSNGAPVAERVLHEGRTFLALGRPESEVIVSSSPPPPSIRFVVGQLSDPGQVRELDEDSLLVFTLSPTYESRTGPVMGLFAVADGMGGHEGGEVASKLALQTLTDQALRSIILPDLSGELMLEEDIVVRLRQATLAANDDVFLTRQKGGTDMGTTMTTVFIRDDRLYLAHVGDCRAYRWNDEGLEQLTTDHSVVANMIAEGQAEPEEIYTHPHRSVIYRCIGDKPVVEVDTDVLPLSPGDRIVVCCDGLWEMVRSEGIQDVMMQEADPQAACELLVSRANAAGGEDNISVIVVQVEAI
jgi:serine/threonine protein phosphatase PrpC